MTAASRLPYDTVVDSAQLPDVLDVLDVLDDEKFDVIVAPVGGVVRTQSLDLLALFRRRRQPVGRR
ncbi:hypothetical protein ACWC24_17165 [Streptomyces sp. NPDC001443]